MLLLGGLAKHWQVAPKPLHTALLELLLVVLLLLHLLRVVLLLLLAEQVVGGVGAGAVTCGAALGEVGGGGGGVGVVVVSPIEQPAPNTLVLMVCKEGVLAPHPTILWPTHCWPGWGEEGELGQTTLSSLLLLLLEVGLLLLLVGQGVVLCQEVVRLWLCQKQPAHPLLVGIHQLLVVAIGLHHPWGLTPLCWGHCWCGILLQPHAVMTPSDLHLINSAIIWDTRAGVFIPATRRAGEVGVREHVELLLPRGPHTGLVEVGDQHLLVVLLGLMSRQHCIPRPTVRDKMWGGGAGWERVLLKPTPLLTALLTLFLTTRRDVINQPRVVGLFVILREVLGVDEVVHLVAV